MVFDFTDLVDAVCLEELDAVLWLLVLALCAARLDEVVFAFDDVVFTFEVLTLWPLCFLDFVVLALAVGAVLVKVLKIVLVNFLVVQDDLKPVPRLV